jgi:hypothetical protein
MKACTGGVNHSDAIAITVIPFVRVYESAEAGMYFVIARY